MLTKLKEKNEEGQEEFIGTDKEWRERDWEETTGLELNKLTFEERQQICI